ncbi:MAG TPA: hypothetical protein VIK63_02470 [Haloplasmataceae bacterium]
MPFKYVLLGFAVVYFLTSLLGLLIRCYRLGFKTPVWVYAVCSYLFLWTLALLAPLGMAIFILKGGFPEIKKISERIIWSIISIPVCFLALIGSFPELIYKVIWRKAEEFNNNLEMIRQRKIPGVQRTTAVTLIKTTVEGIVSSLHETLRVKFV